MDDDGALARGGTPVQAARFLVALEGLSSDAWLRAFRQWEALDVDHGLHERWITASRLVRALARTPEEVAEWESCGKKAFALAFDRAMRSLDWRDGANGPATDFALWAWSAASAAAIADRLTPDVIEIAHAPFAGILAPPVAGVAGTTLPADPDAVGP